jgi:predicted HAD superfamily Cof-like phosphohydrolase
MKELELIKNWRETFSLPVRTNKQLASLDEQTLACNLITEEYNEFISAHLNDNDKITINKTELVDSLGDLLFVIYQAYTVNGLNIHEIVENHIYKNNKFKFKDLIEFFSNNKVTSKEYENLLSYINTHIEKYIEFIENNHFDIEKLENILYDILIDIYILFIYFKLDIEKIIEIIYKSNMSKLCNTEQEAIDSINKYEEQNIEAYYEKISDNQYIIKRGLDNKVLKGINFFKPDFNEIIGDELIIYIE